MKIKNKMNSYFSIIEFYAVMFSLLLILTIVSTLLDTFFLFIGSKFFKNYKLFRKIYDYDEKDEIKLDLRSIFYEYIRIVISLIIPSMIIIYLVLTL